MNSSCPVCDRSIPPVSNRCRCGWIRPEVRATVTEQYIDLTEHTLRAEKWCNERGLNTTEKKIAFCREQMKKLGQKKNPKAWMHNPKSDLARKFRDELLAERRLPVREPGEDFEEDERAAA